MNVYVLQRCVKKIGLSNDQFFSIAIKIRMSVVNHN